MAKAADISFELEGSEKLAKKFSEAVEKTSDKELVEIVEPAAEQVREEASKRAPVRTGELSRNILKRITIAEELEAMFAVSYDEDEVAYGIFQELGWTDRAGHFHAGTPFLRPAADSERKPVIRIIGGRVKVTLAELTVE